MKNEFADCSHGGQIRDFMYVRDVVDAFAALLDSNIQSAVKIASGKARTVKEIVLLTADLLGKRKLVRFGKIPEAENEPSSIVADARCLREELGWTERDGILPGLEQTLEYWKSRTGHK